MRIASPLLFLLPLLFGPADEARAQPPRPRGAAPAAIPAAGETDPQQLAAGVSPDFWLYLQELRRNDDPQVAIRQRAELKAEQRRQRLASQKWYGISPVRPPASPTPYMGSYSPFWSSGHWDPHRWVSYRGAPAVYREAHFFWER